MKKETHRVVAYLSDHARLNAAQIDRFDEKGTLSHLLVLFLSQFELDMKDAKKSLPPEEIKPISELSENDAERQTAFSQQQFRRVKAGNRIDKQSSSRDHRSRRD